jgi:hypothetical protein
MSSSTDTAPADYLAWEARRSRPEFARACVRRRRLKARMDCGHTIDGSELYRYQVWKYVDEPLGQRTDCEVCAREDNRY